MITASVSSSGGSGFGGSDQSDSSAGSRAWLPSAPAKPNGRAVMCWTFQARVDSVWASREPGNHLPLQHVEDSESRLVRQEFFRPGSARDGSAGLAAHAATAASDFPEGDHLVEPDDATLEARVNLATPTSPGEEELRIGTELDADQDETDFLCHVDDQR